MSKTIKLHFVENFSEGDTDGQLEAMKKDFKLVSADECDVLFCASVYKMEIALRLKDQFKVPLVTYCWDYYKWVHGTNYGGLQWGKYAEFLKGCDLVLVPSNGQKLRLKELLDIDSEVCECSVNFYDHETKDENYVLDPVRDYPEENLGWVKKACEELNIPYIHTEHGYTQEEFRKLVSNCTFMTCGYREASTGGLTLMEGLYNGKISLVSNSPYMGASNYIGDLGYYFQYDDFEDLKRKILFLWENRKTIPKNIARKHCLYFTHKRFSSRIKKKILCVLKKNLLKD